ncbi:MAG: hypothetical protein E5Y34_11035 [Mesorhizobium sp.]|uniref:hypothetical protein n=1 Tax=Mesorhizobium sp. TaxID=1871066 RepID=UPI001216BB58|nr:hypothetical protein [Mesorhizobium sp.]TIN00982.1 MAG: hypothetical protein E5Y34_11035 [Mesorhizobium sp.]
MSDKKYHWLFAGQVLTLDSKGTQRQTNLNAVLLTEGPCVTRKDLAKAQQAIILRFNQVAQPVVGSNITDVFMLSVNNLGLMTQAEFHEGFPAESAEDPGKHKGMN